ncbi:MAG: hypothetical protein KME10_28235 [Plectolyngbya sp. WJT66-NPBG17]|jgi:superfamily I DNA and RNA helicase|nr:hypothetical protein [Plectolyngbya sp. WJT66-NPBG17]
MLPSQDLVVRDELKYNDRQTIYSLAWQALRPVTSDNPDICRLIWSYDKAQRLDSLKIPSYREIFGTELGTILSGQRTGRVIQGEFTKAK